jgi:hypothetical protein
MEYQRLRARTFTGLSNDEWDNFAKNLRARFGGGKRSMILSTFIRKYNDLSLCQFENDAQLDQGVHHAMNDTMKFFNQKPVEYRRSKDV